MKEKEKISWYTIGSDVKLNGSRFQVVFYPIQVLSPKGFEGYLTTDLTSCQARCDVLNENSKHCL